MVTLELLKQRFEYEIITKTSIALQLLHNAPYTHKILHRIGDAVLNKRVKPLECVKDSRIKQPYTKEFKPVQTLKKNYDKNKVYLMSNDELPEVSINNAVFVGVATTDALNLLTHHKQEQIILYDINDDQLAYLRDVIEHIKELPTRSAFLAWLLQASEQAVRSKLNNNEGVTTLINTKEYNARIIRDEREVKGALLNQDVIGNIKYLLTTKDTKRYKDYEAFPLMKKNGFLSSNTHYQKLRYNLLSTPICFVKSALTKELVRSITTIYKYETILLWTSNILTPYFYNKEVRLAHEEIIKRTLLQSTPRINLLVDERNYQVRLNPKTVSTKHNKVFKELIGLIQGRTLELQVDKDRNYSYLPSTTIKSLHEVTPEEKDKYDTLFLHSCLSDGALPEYLRVIIENISAKRVIMYEKGSNDKVYYAIARVMHEINYYEPVLNNNDEVIGTISLTTK